MPSLVQIARLLQHEPGFVWLDGGPHSASVLAWSPTEVVSDPTHWPAAAAALSAGGAQQAEVPFDGGCIAVLGYAAGRQTGPFEAPGAAAARALPFEVPHPPPEPEVWLAQYDGALCFDPRTQAWTATGTAAARARGEALLARACETAVAPTRPAACAARVYSTTQAAYEDGVQRVLDWIRDGDHYQLNLTRPVWIEQPTPAWPAYLWLRQHSPAPYGAFLRLRDDLVVLSNSPELFLASDGDRLHTEPIKGTRPRGTSPAQDRAAFEALRDSAKEHAELTMIVDLCRNDLGQVAAPGSVHVGERTLRSYANVHHAAWPVYATLREDAGIWDAIAAAFPPGSVTGAPKVRATQRIAELEPHARGVYCGAIGMVARNGRARLNVAIRTAVHHTNWARYHVGSGIVADSDPTEEWHESVAKGRMLARALAGIEDA